MEAATGTLQPMRVVPDAEGCSRGTLWQLSGPGRQPCRTHRGVRAWHGVLYAELEDKGLILDLRSGEDRQPTWPRYR